MALPAIHLHWEKPVEQRLARLEANVEHIQSDITEIKGDIRRLDSKIDTVKDTVAALALSMEKGFSSLARWGIGLYIGLVAGLLTAFMWIAERLPAAH